MKKNNIAKAVTLAITGTVLSVGAISSASASTAMYNTYRLNTEPTTAGTDGWIWNDGNQKGTTPGASLNPWLGTAGGALPFGYSGSSVLNWAAHVTNAGDSLTISRDAAVATYGAGGNVDIDTSKGAWQDTEAVPQGWAHNTDIGLFKSDVQVNVAITLTSLSTPNAKYGVTLFTGMDTGANYSHHEGWNSPDNSLPYDTSNPFFTDNVIYNSHEVNVDSTNAFEFTAQAGEIYSIYLGGYQGHNFWNNAKERYSLTINTSPVPVPAAVWLFGSGLLGLMSYGRKKAA